MAAPIMIDGLDKFVRNLRKLDKDLPKTLRVAFNAAADIVIQYAKPKVPQRTGRAAKSIRARSTAKTVRITAGGPRAPYYPWLDFGGSVGRKKSVKRPFMKEGRFLYAGLHAERDKVHAAVSAALIEAARAAGVAVD